MYKISMDTKNKIYIIYSNNEKLFFKKCKIFYAFLFII